MQEIPLSGGAANSHQTFSVQLGDNYLDFTLNYVSYTDTQGWSMDISVINSYSIHYTKLYDRYFRTDRIG